MEDTGLGRRIRLRRMELGLGVRELARRVGIEPSRLSQVESSSRPVVRSNTLQRLAYHLGVTADWLIGSYEPDPEDKSEEDTLATAVRLA